MESRLLFDTFWEKKSRSRNLSYSFVLQYFGLQWLCFLLPSCDSLVCRLAALAMQDNGLNLDQTLESQVGLEAQRRSSKCSLSRSFQSLPIFCLPLQSDCFSAAHETEPWWIPFHFRTSTAPRCHSTDSSPSGDGERSDQVQSRWNFQKNNLTWISQWGMRRYARSKYSQLLASGQCLASSMLHASKSRMRSWDEFHVQKRAKVSISLCASVWHFNDLSSFIAWCCPPLLFQQAPAGSVQSICTCPDGKQSHSSGKGQCFAWGDVFLLTRQNHTKPIICFHLCGQSRLPTVLDRNDNCLLRHWACLLFVEEVDTTRSAGHVHGNWCLSSKKSQ